MMQLIFSHKKLVLALCLVFLITTFGFWFYLNLPKTEEEVFRQNVRKEISKFPKRFQQVLGEGTYGQTLIDADSYYMRYYPTTQAFTVVLADVSKKMEVEKNIETYFKGFGFKDLNTLKIDYCTEIVDNLEKNVPRWNCEI